MAKSEAWGVNSEGFSMKDILPFTI
jgi:hypothetical protein